MGIAERPATGTLVPEGVIPGSSTLWVADDQGGGAEIVIPREAVSGDVLLLHSLGPADGYQCRIRRRCSGSCSKEDVPHLHLEDGSTHTRRIVVEVPQDAQPGRTVLTLAVSSTTTLRVPLPDGIRPGDRLALDRSDTGEWKCDLLEDLRQAQREEYIVDSARPTRDPLTGDEVAYCEVPPNSEPGRTILEVGGGDSEVFRVVVPIRARKGDQLEVRRISSSDLCNARILQPLEGCADVSEVCRAFGPAANAPQACFYDLVDKARTAGATVSPKFERGVGSLGVMGLIARAPIEKGEELVIMPRRLALLRLSLAEMMPQVCEAVKHSSREDECKQAACLGLLMQQVARAHAGNVTEGTVRENIAPGTEDVWAVWRSYAEALLAENFEAHPYVRAATDYLTVREFMEPSTEFLCFKAMIQDVFALHKGITDGTSCAELASLEAPFFFRARLCLLTRSFQTSKGPALVPITDFTNHMPGEPGAIYEWDSARDSHVLYATRQHEPGEEIFTTYGPRSNVLLFRTYGFTIPPMIEPSWGYVVQWDRPMDIMERYLPDEMRKRAIQLETWAMENSLATVLNACADYGGNPAQFLYDLCTRCLERYENDLSLQQALDGLRRARNSDPASSAWWAYPPDGSIETEIQARRASEESRSGKSAAVDPDYPHSPWYVTALSGTTVDWSEPAKQLWLESSIRVKMSEYLCLTAHIEAVSRAAGRVPEESCLAMSAYLRETIADALRCLAAGNHFTLGDAKADED